MRICSGQTAFQKLPSTTPIGTGTFSYKTLNFQNMIMYSGKTAFQKLPSTTPIGTGTFHRNH